MVEGVLNTPDELTEEAVRPLDPDGDAEMTDQPPIISPPVALGPPSSTVPEANGSSDKVEGRLGEQELAQIEYRKGKCSGSRPRRSRPSVPGQS